VLDPAHHTCYTKTVGKQFLITITYPYLDFIRGADLLIFDAQYSLQEAIDSKENWGHSSNMTGIELAINARVRHLMLFHSEPTVSDETLYRILQESLKYADLYSKTLDMPCEAPEVSMAYDGLELDLP